MSKKKISLAIIAAFVVLITSVSAISYSIANKQNKKIDHRGATNASGSNTIIGNLGELDHISNIDRIIENSYNTDESSNYYVLEVFPSGEEDDNSPLKQYIENGGFKKWVIDENAELGKEMMDKKIVYRSLVAASDTDALGPSGYGSLTISQVIQGSDLIYLSSSQIGSYSKLNDMSPSVFHELDNYALSINNKRPIIIDDLGIISNADTQKRSYQVFANDVKNFHIRYRTFGWDVSKVTPKDFFEASGKSFYIPYDVNSLVASGSRASGNILIVSNEDENGSTNAFYNALVNYGGTDGKNIIDDAYIGDRAKRPEKITYTFITPAKLQENLDNNNKLFDETYDFIFFEESVKTTEISDAVYKQFHNMARKSKYLFYPQSWILAPGENFVVDTDSNFHTLYGKLVGFDGKPRFNNVLLVPHAFFFDINGQQQDNKDEAKKVADLINGSVYRGYGGGPSGNDNRMYRVLEIQPCYPIDLELAKTQSLGVINHEFANQVLGNGVPFGAYYLKPNDVKYGFSKDEVGEGVEYYAFELSRAKIAHLTGLSINQIKLDCMSTEELISSKEVISEYYDLIYVGGDKSALVPYTLAFFKGYRSGNQRSEYLTNKVYENLTAFDMYTHTGIYANMVDASSRFYPSNDRTVAGRIDNGKGDKNNTFVQLNGNDLTTIKLDELKRYVDAGLPIIFDHVVTDAFEKSYTYDPDQIAGAEINGHKADRVAQLALREIDPDSNMYKFLKYVYGVKGSQSNICWGEVDTDDSNSFQRVDNKSGIYGNTVYDDVEVYSDDVEKIYADLIVASRYRPRIVLKSKPKDYVENGSDIVNIGPTVSFDVSLLKIDKNVDNYTVKLYVDFNGDNVYNETDDERKDTALYGPSADTVTLSFKLDNDYIGPVNWKIVAIDADDKLCDMVQGISYFKPQGDVKKKIRVLQIMPVPTDQQDMYNGKVVSSNQAEGGNAYSLYFCTECQMCTNLIKYNPLSGKNGDKSTGNMIDSFNDLGFSSRVNKESIFEDKVHVGLHEHKFGIVSFNDSSDVDNWADNLADPLTHGQDKTLATGEYEFDLDILTNDQFDKIFEDAAKRTDAEAEANKTDAKAAKESYENMLKDHGANGSATIPDTKKLSYLGGKLETAMYDAVDKLPDSFQYKDFIKINVGTSGLPGQWIKDKDYYKFWEFYNPKVTGKEQIDSGMDDLVKAYNDYVELYDEVVKLKQTYKENLYNSATLNNKWLAENYDVIVLGFAEDFGGQDLSEVSVEQIKDFVENSNGSILNTHDTLTRYKTNGSRHLTDGLRQVFGQDRFHVVGVGSGTTGKSKVSVVIPPKEVSFTITEAYNENFATCQHKNDITLEPKDADLYFTKVGDNNYIYDESKTTYKTSNAKADSITITCHIEAYNAIGIYDPTINKVKYTQAQGDGIVVFEVPVQNIASATFELPEGNTNGVFDVTANAVTLDAAGNANADGSVDISLDVTDGTNALADDTEIRVTCKGKSQFVKVAGGKISFTIQPSSVASTADIYEEPTDGTMYRKYETEDSTKFFWTTRGVFDESVEDRATWEKRVNYLLGYNSPIGMTDFFASIDSAQSYSSSPYRYARSLGSNDQVLGWPNQSQSYDAKYGGCRNASQVNLGNVTFYPFNVSSELMISSTHAQFYALDLEDPAVSVWYTLAGSKAVKDKYLDVSDEFAFKGTSYYAASPRDGMDSYFLYSKRNVYYCGAGNATITGIAKRNNDERRLFINIIVNSVSKGKTKMKLNLYNKCDKDDNCDEEYVDKDIKKNAKLAKEENKLFFNESIDCYQYNIAEQDGCPEFDFKALAGAEAIKKITVFYDLNYGDGSGLDYSDEYKNDTDHVEIVSYEKTHKRDGIRNRLREDGLLEKDADLADKIKDNLPLKEEYFKNYGNFTYIVINVEDENGNIESARIRINLIPRLFDLTDATSTIETQKNNSNVITLDLSDKSKFNI